MDACDGNGNVLVMSEKEERPGVGPDVFRDEAKGATSCKESRSIGGACACVGGGGRGEAPGRVFAGGGGGGLDALGLAY